MTRTIQGSQTPTEYRVRAVNTRAGARIETASEVIAFDAEWPSSGVARLPGPADLLASALAACLLKNVERCAELMPFRYTRATVDVTASRQDRPPRFVHFHFRLDLVTEEPARRLELLHTNLRRYGTVYNTLASVCEIDGEVVASPLSAETTAASTTAAQDRT